MRCLIWKYMRVIIILSLFHYYLMINYMFYYNNYYLNNFISARVDRLEGHPDWYTRKPVEVELMIAGGEDSSYSDGGRGGGGGVGESQLVTAHLYFNDNVTDEKETVYGSDLVFIKSGDFRDHYKPTGLQDR